MADLDDLLPEDREDASPARRYIRENFDAMARARARGVTWQQITDAMTEAGVSAVSGSALEWRGVKSLYHTERYARGGKRERTRRAVAVQPKPAAPAPQPSPLGPLVITADPPPLPAEAPVPDQSVPRAPAATPEPSAMPAADPELARRLNSLRTIEEVPAMALPAGWRKRKGNEDG